MGRRTMKHLLKLARKQKASPLQTCLAGILLKLQGIESATAFLSDVQCVTLEEI